MVVLLNNDYYHVLPKKRNAYGGKKLKIG